MCLTLYLWMQGMCVKIIKQFSHFVVSLPTFIITSLGLFEGIANSFGGVIIMSSDDSV